jgi:F-type H+-transporting ATPase subunit b
VSLPGLSSAALSGVLLFSSEEGEHASRFLGLPMWIWQILNLVLFFAVLIHFVAKPLATAFRKRQQEIEERRLQADKQRGEVQRLSEEIRERTAKLEREIEEIRRQGVAEGESARTELAARADEEAARAGKDAQEEIARRLAEAKVELRKTAAALTAERSAQILAREITDEDRRRLLDDGVNRLKQAPR